MIKRRRLVALVSAVVLLVIGLVVFATGLVVTRTSYGQDQLRRLIQSQLTTAVRGKVYVGPMSGGFLTGVTIDSLAIRDADNDSLFISTGRITVNYDPRDLIDKRLWLRNVEVEHPKIFVRQHASGRWNFKEIFRSYDKKSSVPKAPGRNFGDYVVIDSARVHDATFVLQMPWQPDDTLRGAKLDSAIRYTLARKDKDIKRVIDGGKAGFVHTWKWTNGYAVVSRMRLADPDSDRIGRLFVIDTLHAVENDPPFRFRNVRGSLRHLGDSIWLDLPHWDLPRSTGSAKGKIVWGSDLPVRYDIAVRGDSVALADVSWVYPTLPTTGGGTVVLHIGTEKENLRIIDYKLTSMDVRSTDSHLVGDMTFAVGGPILAVKDVKLSAQPVDFELLRTLNGKPFPVDWRGQLVGSVRARGGPLTRFYVDEGEALFRDAHVRGAVSRVGGQGELNILQPALTSFRHFDVNVASMDLRTIEYLYPNFPRLAGTISGKATLDSSWLDVRFSNADVVHRDGPGEPSHLTGSGRVTWGELFLTYDLDAQAQPLSLTMLARSYPRLPLLGLVSGPLRATGTIADLQLSTSLQGTAGALTFDGKVDIDPPSYGLHGTGQLTALAVHQLLDPARLKGHTLRPAVLTGRYDVGLTGDSLSNLQGSLALDIARADVDGLRFFPSSARLRFGDRRLFVDSLRVETTAATLLAHGALGLPHGASDSLSFRVLVDSLGGLRRYIAGQTARGSTVIDSLAGSAALRGVARGRIDSLDLAGSLTAMGLFIGKDRGRSVSGRFALRNALADPQGNVSLRVDTLTIGGVLLDSINTDVQLDGQTRAAFRVGVYSDNGPTARLAGTAISSGGAIGARLAATRVALDSLLVSAGDSRWHLLAPSHLTRDSVGLGLDSLVLGNGAGGRVAVRGVAPMHAPIALEFSADSVGLADFGVIAQLQPALGGYANFRAGVTGTRVHPEVALSSEVRGFVFGGARVERAAVSGTYRNQSFDLALDLFRNRVAALHATAAIPLDLSLWGAQRLNAPIRGSIRADSADLAIVEMLSPNLQNASGRLTANLDIVASKSGKSINGIVALRGGDVRVQNLGIRVRDITGDVRFDGARDSVHVDVRAWSGSGPSSRLGLRGFLNYADWEDPRFAFSLFAKNFHALDKRSLASLDLSTGDDSLRLIGSMDGAVLTGKLSVDRGAIYLPERDIARKQVVDLTSDDLFQLIDSTDFRNRQIVPDASSRLLERLRLDGVSVALGDEVWLRSREANIKLVGSLNVRSARKQSALAVGRSGPAKGDTLGLALEGQLTAERGTYTLDLSPAPVSREFTVQNGTITFYGSADLNPYLDINATHDVKRAQQPDLVIAVHIVGTLSPHPAIELTAPNESYLSTSDLVSYLVTGQPTYALNSADRKFVEQASTILFPTLTAYAAQSLRNSIGSWVDVLQFQGGASQLSGLSGLQAQNSFRDYFYGARLGGEKQISNNLFFSFSAGLCSLNRETMSQAGQSAVGGFVQSLGGKLEYRFNPKLSLQAGTDPPTSALYCGGKSGVSLGSVVSTPRQGFVSLLRTWHF
jgi:translocation and assembly module TamB